MNGRKWNWSDQFHKMKTVFFGTPDYVLPILTALHKVYGVIGVVTQKPKEIGRKKFITRSPIDNWAYKHKVEVIYDLNKIPEADLGILAAYGEIIPEAVIKKLKFGILNVHPSLLPKWRGASPIQAANAPGQKQTGVTIIKLDGEIDHGPIVSQFTEDILDSDTTATLRQRLFERSADVLVALIKPYLDGKITPRPQNHQEATFTRQLKKESGFIDLTNTKPDEAERFIRAMQPWPGAWTLLRLSATEGQTHKRLKIIKAHLETDQLVLDTVQLEGKNPVSYEEFKKGYPKVTFTKE